MAFLPFASSAFFHANFDCTAQFVRVFFIWKFLNFIDFSVQVSTTLSFATFWYFCSNLALFQKTLSKRFSDFELCAYFCKFFDLYFVCGILCRFKCKLFWMVFENSILYLFHFFAGITFSFLLCVHRNLLFSEKKSRIRWIFKTSWRRQTKITNNESKNASSATRFFAN